MHHDREAQAERGTHVQEVDLENGTQLNDITATSQRQVHIARSIIHLPINQYFSTLCNCRSRSSSRDRRHYHDHHADHSIAAEVQQQQLAALQQQLLHAQRAAVAAAGLAAALPPSEEEEQKLESLRRIVYVGNLAVGIITKELLEEFFNQAFAHLVDDPIAAPPVLNIKMEAQGRFAFVELRSRELANQALLMDKIVDIHGRQLQVGRPKGYIEPTGPPLYIADRTGTIIRVDAAHGAGTGNTNTSSDLRQPSKVLLLSNILQIKALRIAESRKFLEEEVKEEASKHGEVQSVAVPPPPEEADDRGPGRAYILYSSKDEAVKSRKVFHTRTLDDSTINAKFVDQGSFLEAKQGKWPSHPHPTVNGLSLEGLYAVTPLVSGVSGIAVLNASLGLQVQSHPSILNDLADRIDREDVPFEEGWVKLRGFPPSISKSDIVAFFSECGHVTEHDVKMVYSADGTSLGEAFVNIRGENAKLRLALSKDKMTLPGEDKAHAEVLTAHEEDVQRRMLSGCRVE